MLRRSPLVVAFALAFTLISPAVGARAASLPNSMAALGDSITQAYNTGPSAYRDYPAGSWSTGTTASVNSHYLRISAQNQAIVGMNFNDAVSGSKVADLAAQVTVANGQQAEYITILIGGNDVCTRSEATMTSVTDFRTRFETAMRSLAPG